MNNSINPFIFIDFLNENEHMIPMYPIPGLVDIEYNKYYISDFGRVFSLIPNRNNGEFYELKPNASIDGYLRICLYFEGKGKTYLISRLVLYYFVGVPYNPSLYEANHKDYNRTNNHLSNLEWLSHKENVSYSFCNRDRITDFEMMDIYDRIYNKGQSYEDVAKLYNRSRYSIMSVANGSNKYKERHDKLGLPDMRRHVTIEDGVVACIYNDLLAGMNRYDCADKYNITTKTVDEIKLKKGRFAEILKDYEDIESLNNRKFTKEQAKDMYFKIANMQDKKQSEICEALGVTAMTMLDIKFCRNSYQFLQDEYGLAPLKKSPNITSEELALRVYTMAKNKKSVKDIREATGLSADSINDIRFCRDGFEYLMEKYNLEPLTPLKNRKPKEYLSEDQALKAYFMMKNDKYSAVAAAEVMNCPINVMKELKLCRGRFSYLKTKYNLEPLEGRTDYL